MELSFYPRPALFQSDLESMGGFIRKNEQAWLLSRIGAQSSFPQAELK